MAKDVKFPRQRLMSNQDRLSMARDLLKNVAEDLKNDVDAEGIAVVLFTLEEAVQTQRKALHKVILGRDS